MSVLMIMNAEMLHRGAFVWNTTHTGISRASMRDCRYIPPDNNV